MCASMRCAKIIGCCMSPDYASFVLVRARFMLSGIAQDVAASSAIA